MQFAVLNSSKALADRDLEFMVKGCSIQVEEFAKVWGLDVVTADLYRSVDQLPTDDVMVCEILDSLDEPGALGYHANDGRPYQRILAQGAQTSITLSHEFLETLGDPTCDRWAPMPDGREVAVEVCDPVEGDSYGREVPVLGMRTVQLSNYVTPQWFDATATEDFDRLGTVSAPFGMSPGGYMVVLEKGGQESEVFARLTFGIASQHGKNRAAEKLQNGTSRLLKRLRGRP